MGPLGKNLLEQLTPWLKEKVEASESANDSILILTLQVQDIQKMTILGRANIEVNELARTAHTLFF